MGKKTLLLTSLLVLCLLAGCGAAKERMKAAEAHYLLGVSFLQEGNSTLALKEFLLAEESNAADADIQAALGHAYHLKKAYAESEGHYLKALEIDRDAPRVQNNLAALYLDMERWDDAIRYFRKASSNILFAGSEVALTGMGYAHFKKGEYLEAAAACKEATARNARYPQAHFRLGEVYYVLGKTEAAIEAFRQAVSLAPAYTSAHYRLALSCMKARDTAAAATSFGEVVRLAPDSELGRLAADYLKLLQ